MQSFSQINLDLWCETLSESSLWSVNKARKACYYLFIHLFKK